MKQPTRTILYTAQGTQVHIVTDDGIYQHYDTKAARILGILQIVLGILIIITQSVVIAVEAQNEHDIPGYGYQGRYVGLWASVMFILAGIFGLISAKYKSRCTVIVTMVLSSIAAVFTTAVMAEGGMGAASNEHNEYKFDWTANDGVDMAFNIFMVVLSLTEAIVAIVAAVYCCLGSCQSKPQWLFTNQGLISLNKEVPYQPLYDERDLSAPPFYSGTTPPQYVEKV